MPTRRALVSGVATAGLAAVAGCSGSTRPDPELSGDWRQVGRDRTNRNYARAVTLPAELSESWRATIGSWPYVPPVIDDGTVFAAGSRGVFGLDAEDGEQLWHRELDGEISGGLAVAGDAVVVPEHGPTGDRLLGLERDSGTDLWEVPLDSRPFAPSVSHDRNLYVRTRDACLRVRHGELRWRTGLDRLGYDRYNVTDSTDFTATVAPAVGTTGVVVPDRDAVVALDLDEGTEQWRVPLDGTLASPVVVNETVLAVGIEETVAVGDQGAERWRVGRGGWATLASDGLEAYVLGGDELTVLGVEDGERRWATSMAGDVQRSQPAAFSDSVLAVNEGGVAVRRDDPGLLKDRELLQFDGATDHGGVAVGAGRVVVVNGSRGDVVAFEPA